MIRLFLLRQRFQRVGFLLGSAAALLLLAACAPQVLIKNSSTVVQYPYTPVESGQLAEYQRILRESPRSVQAVEARFWIAQDAYNRHDWVKAERQFFEIRQKYPNSEWAPVAGLMTARSRAEQKKYLAATTELLQLQSKYSRQLELVQAARDLARRLINDNLSLEELARLRASFPNTPWDEQALFVIGKRNLDQGDLDSAARLFDQFLSQYPQSEFTALAQELRAKAGQIIPVNRQRIGCLLPLSGPYAPFGRSLLEGVELALNQVNAKRGIDDQLGLAVVDCQGTTEGAWRGLFKLAEQEKVMTIIGPALSATAKFLMPELTRYRICTISPAASEASLTSESPYFFRYMLTNQEQGAAMAEHVVLRENIQRVAIINGEDIYDRTLADAFAARVLELGGEVVARVEYPRGTTDFKEQLLLVGGTDPGRVKDADLQERKSIEALSESFALEVQRLLAPEENGTGASAKPNGPQRTLAVVRLIENGDLAQQWQLGKMTTEKLSYALARKAGIEVVTQNKTFQSLRQLGLSTVGLTAGELAKLGRQLQVRYVVMGDISQQSENIINTTSEPLPVECLINLQLIDTQNGTTLLTTSRKWSKRLAPQTNLKGVEAIYLPVPARDAVLIASQLAFYDLPSRIFGGDAWLSTQILRQADDGFEGAVFATGFWMDDPSPTCQTFVHDFEERYKAQPTQLAVQAYDTMKLVAAVLDQMTSGMANRDAFRTQLLRAQKYPGVTGQATIEPNGEIKRQAVVLKISKGTLKRIQ